MSNSDITISNNKIDNMKRKSLDEEDEITLLNVVKIENQNIKKPKLTSSEQTPGAKENQTPESSENDENKSKSKEEEKKLREEKRLKEKKLKEEEKLRKQEEKEQEKRRKEEERAKEKRFKEEEREREKRRKEQAREEDRKRKEEAREEEKKRKEEQRLLKEQEKKQKEEAREAEKRKKEEREKRGQLSLGSFFNIEAKKETRPISTTETEQTNASTYKTYFLPFHVRNNMKLVSLNHLSRANDNGDMTSWLKSHRKSRGRPPLATASDLINILNEKSLDEEELSKIIEKVPTKYLYFHEDIRPPYVGSFSKYVKNIALNPYERIVPDINYDYDSEVEWIQDEEGDGEDIGDEDSDDNLDDDEDDLDGFLDEDSDEINNGRRQIIGPLKVSLICNDGSETDVFSPMKIQHIIPIDGPIDPYKDYWSEKNPIKSITMLGKPEKTEKQLRTVPKEALTGVLQKVHGSDMSLILLVEIVKREFPKLSKESIRNTIKCSATQHGQKDQKRWQVNDQYQQYLI